ncbi:MAG: putative transrane protein, partial [Myxococcaceae bacterium]|nr:putative transrane protein [Myxococcaceae bacterium]
DVGALALIALTWAIILRADSAETKRRAGGDDPGRHAVFGIALVASMFSFFAAAFVLRQVKNVPDHMRSTWTALTLGAIVLAWTLAHTVYTLRYAHLYYSRRHSRGGSGEHCMKFPGDEPPADIDFAYFSFTLGMCFQVSDVTVMSTNARRAVLLHAVLSFVYNTAILALALNLVFGSMS